MQNTLKGWLVDNTVTTDNKDDKILLLHSAGSVTLDNIYKEMEDANTGLSRETLVHVTTLFLRILSRLILNGYSVNAGLFRAVAQFTGVVEGGKWDPTKNSVYVSFVQDKMLREEIQQTTVEILGVKANVMYILEVEDKKTKLKDGTATPGRNFFVRGALLKIAGDNPACGVTLLKEGSTTPIQLEEDLITSNKPSELTLLLPADLTDGVYTLTVTTQYTSGSTILLKEPRSVSTQIRVGAGGGGDDDKPDSI